MKLMDNTHHYKAWQWAATGLTALLAFATGVMVGATTTVGVIAFFIIRRISEYYE